MDEKPRWMEVIETAADAHLGRTLVRLAALAEAAHLFEEASSIQRKDRNWVHGCDPWAEVPDSREPAAEARTEVSL